MARVSSVRRLRPGEADDYRPVVRKPEAVPLDVRVLHAQINNKLDKVDQEVGQLMPMNLEVDARMEAEIQAFREDQNDSEHRVRELRRSHTKTLRSEYDILCFEIAQLQNQLTHLLEERKEDQEQLLAVALDNRRLRAETRDARAEHANLKQEIHELERGHLRSFRQQMRLTMVPPVETPPLERRMTDVEHNMVLQGLHQVALRNFQSVGATPGRKVMWSSRLRVMRDVTMSAQPPSPRREEIGPTNDAATDTEVDRKEAEEARKKQAQGTQTEHRISRRRGAVLGTHATLLEQLEQLGLARGTRGPEGADEGAG